jgi:hypothetical protein
MIGFQPGTNPLSLYDELKTLAAPAVTFFSGGKYAPRSEAMDQNLKDSIMSQYDKTGIMSGVLGYSDFDKSQTPGTEFPNLPLMSYNLFSGKVSPAQFSNAMTGGRLTYDINPDTGKVTLGSNKYNFRPEMATIDPSDPLGQKAFSYFAGKANERNREINPDISIPVDYLRGFGRDFSQFGDSNLGQKLADSNLSKTLSNSIFTPAYGDIPTKEERQGIESFNNLVSDTVMAEPNQFQDYPGDKNLGSVQDQNLGFDYNFDENVLKEEEDAQYNLDNKGSFNMEGILQNLKDYLPFIGDKSITGMLTSGIGQFFNNIGDRISNTPQYQRYTPGYNYGNLNPNLIDDFYDPATGLNRFDRAKTLFGQSRTLSEYLSKKRAAAAKAVPPSGDGGSGGGGSQDFFDSQGFGSEALTNVSTDFGSFDLSRD